ncbi:rhizobiocin [Sphingobium yanoikuyae]|uniref:Rhizobiocin n=1 Tax=Sphingobium yanoikuyae TaxID=13690 RepID=A0A6P1GQP5_SPHYA|nr:calcium-binding protein [Sphingobium yanoikuyae]QHD69761.1 rhizobiocin [Sphingobium yanoikuyae]
MTDYAGGPENNNWTITPADGTSSINGGGGTDSLTIDWSTSDGYYQAGSWSGPASSGYTYDYGYGYSIGFSNIEQLTVKFGSGDSEFSIGNNAVISLDGGAGSDYFRGNFSDATANISLTLNETAGTTSTITGQGSTLRNVERLDITTGSGNDSLTGGSLNDSFNAGSGTNTINGGAGNDSITSTGTDTVNGGADYDYWYGNYGSRTTALNVTQSGSVYTLSNGGSVSNVEYLQLTTGSGNDSFSVVTSGNFYAGTGTDSITVDWSGSDGYSQTGYYYGPDSALSTYDYGYAYNVTGYGIDGATVKFGSGEGEFSIDTDGIVAFDGGAGNDYFHGDFSDATANISLTLNETAGATSTITGQGSTLRNVERLDISTGSGNDSLTGGSLNDRLIGGAGNDLIDGGAGDDYLIGGDGTDTLSFASSANAITFSLALHQDASNDVGNGNDYVSGFESLTGSAFADTLSGDTGANVLDGGAGADTLVGGAGNDIYIVDNAGDVVTEAASAGTDEARTTLASYTLSSNVEKLTGLLTTGQTLTGNSLANTINGGAGNDTLDGGTGADTLVGGAGNDIYIVDNIGDVVTEAASAGTDEARTTLASYTLGANVEKLTGLLTTGQTLTGNSLANTINGGTGNDTLDGGTGADTLVGGAGNDIYIVDNSGDVVTEAASAGTDEARTTLASYTLSSNVEKLTGLLTTGQTLTGNSLSNTINGGAGNDTLDGGTGADTLVGGAGNDIYIVDNIGDVVTEAASAGTDDARTTLASYTLGANVEKLTGLLTTGQTLTGNSLANTINGGTGNDTLDGGTGADTLVGGAGNDIYIVDNAGDVVTEAASAGTDEARTTLASYTLSSNVEKLTGLLTTGQTLTGNSLANTINGGTGNDTLDGGTGADTLVGGAGNDIYIVDNAGDVVTEAASAGTDEARTTLASYTLSSNVEKLTGLLTTGQTLTGNSLANTINGGTGNDTLDGGTGADTLAGGAGADQLFGGAGFDAADYSSSTGVTVSLDASLVATGDAAGDAFSSIEALYGSLTGADRLRGNAANNFLVGGGGNDTLEGMDGDDILAGGAGGDSLFGGAGLDVADYRTSSGVTVSLDGSLVRTGDAVGDGFSSIEGFYGSLTGADRLRGNAANNILVGNGGNDTLEGMDGNDVLEGGAGADAHIGGVGMDAASYRSSLTGVTVSLDNTLVKTGDAVGDTFSGIESLYGSLTGNDHLRGNAGNNAFEGGGGDDLMEGGLGNDWLLGGDGLDIMTGGGGQDTFLFTTPIGPSSIDTITDFSPVDDTIRLENDIFTGLPLGLLRANAFTIGTAATDTLDRIIYNADTGALYFDVDGSGAAAAVQFASLTPHLAMTAGDFLVI